MTPNSGTYSKEHWRWLADDGGLGLLRGARFPGARLMAVGLSISLAVSWGWHNTAPQTGPLKPQRCVLSWSRRPEVQDPGVDRVRFS